MVGTTRCGQGHEWTPPVAAFNVKSLLLEKSVAVDLANRWMQVALALGQPDVQFDPNHPEVFLERARRARKSADLDVTRPHRLL
jgi:hypothetical protein